MGQVGNRSSQGGERRGREWNFEWSKYFATKDPAGAFREATTRQYKPLKTIGGQTRTVVDLYLDDDVNSHRA